MAIPDQYKEMIDGLTAASKAGRVHWQESSPSTFSVSFSSFSLEIGNYHEPPGDDMGIALRLRDASGEVVDYLSIAERQSDYGKLETLLDLARRKAKNIDLYISQVLSELKSGGAIGDTPDEEPPPGKDNLPLPPPSPAAPPRRPFSPPPPPRR